MTSFRVPAKHLLILLAILLFSIVGCSNSDDDEGTAGGSSGTPTFETSADLNGYLTAAIYDEYKARDTYRVVIAKFGEVRPFTRIMPSEEQHISQLTTLFNTYGLSVPSDTVGGLPAPASLSEACSVGVQAEIDNAQMYDSLLYGTGNYPDVQAVFRGLQAASLEQHLPAFRRCAN